MGSPENNAPECITGHLKAQLPGFSLQVELNLPGSGITVVLGSSGAGKTTLLRCIAGLEKNARGFLRVKDDVWLDDANGILKPAHSRSLGYVFQDARLFTHLNVQDNLEYAIKRNRKVLWGPSLEGVIEACGIASLLKRSSIDLSGGEKQRVALARALLTAPSLLLMDEPLASLDMESRQRLLDSMEKLQKEWGVPMVYVTHSINEAARLADHLVFMTQGEIMAQGLPSDLLSSHELMQFNPGEPGVFIRCRVLTHDPVNCLAQVEAYGQTLTLPLQASVLGKEVRLHIAARDVSLALDPPKHTSILNVIPVSIIQLTEHLPGQVLVQLEGHETQLLSLVTTLSARHLRLETGRSLYALIKGMALAP